MFDDRLEIVSPGALPNIVTLDNMRNTRYSRNPRIAHVGRIRMGSRVERGRQAHLYRDAGLPAQRPGIHGARRDEGSADA
ncbi:MAG: ATP-binding protein [Collinsella sp.]